MHTGTPPVHYNVFNDTSTRCLCFHVVCVLVLHCVYVYLTACVLHRLKTMWSLEIFFHMVTPVVHTD